jgi:hypothetical protein
MTLSLSIAVEAGRPKIRLSPKAKRGKGGRKQQDPRSAAVKGPAGARCKSGNRSHNAVRKQKVSLLI